MARRRKAGGGAVKVKKHSRSPRGPDGGKARPRVRSYTRKKPNPNSYPRYPGRRRKRRSK